MCYNTFMRRSLNPRRVTAGPNPNINPEAALDPRQVSASPNLNINPKAALDPRRDRCRPNLSPLQVISALETDPPLKSHPQNRM